MSACMLSRHLLYARSTVKTGSRSASTRTTAANLASEPAPRRPPPSLPTKPSAYKPPQPAGGAERLERTNNKTVWRSWKDLPYTTKLVFCAGAAIFATVGLLTADKLEELFPARNYRGPERRSQIPSSPTDADQPRMIDDEHHVPRPKLFSISVVDKDRQ